MAEHVAEKHGGPPEGSFGSKFVYYYRSLPITKYLLIFVPLSLWMEVSHGSPTWLFIVTALGILSLVTLIGKATEEIAMYTSATIGGLLNATFGNVTELIIAAFALKKGLYGIVKASIVGSILGNLLLLLGMAMFVGGLKYPTQKFSRVGSSVNVSMLGIALIAMMVPSLLSYGSMLDPDLQTTAQVNSILKHTSIGIAVIMLVVYLLSLVFSLKTHKFVFMPDITEEEEHPEWGKGFAIAMLLGVTVLVGIESDIFVSSLEHMMKERPILTQSFMGVVVVAIVGNAAEGSVAIWVARQNKMELSFQVVMGSCIQVALFVTPMLVLMSLFLGPTPMTLNFNVVQTASIWASVLIASLALQDGESNWFEGVMFLAVYAIFALVYFFHP
jgi:Ca2+:H+ antiporter